MKFFVILGTTTVVWLNFFQYGAAQIPLPMPMPGAFPAPPVRIPGAFLGSPTPSISPYFDSSFPSPEMLDSDTLDRLASADLPPGISRATAPAPDLSSDYFDVDGNRSKDADGNKATTTTTERDGNN